jgi:hypothetical protein
MASPEDEEFAAADALVRAAAFPRVNAGDLASIVGLLAAEPTIVAPCDDSGADDAAQPSSDSSRMFYEGPDLCLVDQLELVVGSSEGANSGHDCPSLEPSQDVAQRTPPLVVQYFGMVDPTQYVAAGSGGIYWNGSVLLARFLVATRQRSLLGLESTANETLEQVVSSALVDRGSKVEDAESTAPLVEGSCKVVVELGAGATGVPGLAAARALLGGLNNESASKDALAANDLNGGNLNNGGNNAKNYNVVKHLRVVLTDSRSKLIPLLERNIALNSLPGGWLDSSSSNSSIQSTNKSRRTTEGSTINPLVEVRAAQLDWREAIRGPDSSSKLGNSIDKIPAQEGGWTTAAMQLPIDGSCSSKSSNSTSKPLLGHLVADHEVDLVLGAEVATKQSSLPSIYTFRPSTPCLFSPCRLFKLGNELYLTSADEFD